MKKSLSLLLAVIMTLSVFSAAIIPADAAFTSTDVLSVTASEFANDQITFTITLKNGVKNLVGANIRAKFDSTVLEVVSGAAAGTSASPNVSGTYETGVVKGNANEYALAYINASATGYTTSADTAFFTITFKAVSADRPDATVDFTCIEFITEDDNDENDLRKSDAVISTLDSFKFKTLGTPVITSVDSSKDSIKVQWGACTGADVYNVYRADKGDEIFATVEGTSFTDDTIKQNVEYTYYVSAQNESGATVKSVGKSGMYFGAIDSISTSAAVDGIKVSWGALDKADNYDVLRKLATEDESKFRAIENVTTTEYVDTTAASGVEYSYSIRAHHKQYTAGMAVPAENGIYIAVPKLYVANVSGGLQISVTTVGGASSYEIKKSVNGGAYSVIKMLDSSSLSFIDTAVSGDVKYSYTVQAIANASLKSAVSTQVVATRLATPVVKLVENKDGSIYVNWGAVANATSYDVYRKTGNGAFTPIGSSNTLSYDDTTVVGGAVYTYAVVAKNNTGCGAYDTTGKTIKRLSTPANIISRTNGNGIYVTWNAVSGADSYTIFRNGTQVGTSNTTRFEDKTAAQNTIYKYTIRANSGSYVSAINATGAQGMNFGTVSSLKYTAIKNGITLTWNKLGNAEGYRVYRKTASDSAYSRIATVTSGTSYNDTQMSSGTVYYYAVEAYKGTVVADMSAPVLSAKYLSVPVFTARNSGDDIKITINAVRGADTYVIERATGSSTAYKHIANLTSGKLEYLDVDNDSTNDIVAGEKYTYRVRAVSGNIKSFDGVVSMYKMKAPELTHYYNEVAGIQLKWTPVEEATQYYIYRKVSGSSSWGSAIAVTQKTEYLDASVVSNTIYQYTVEAKTPDGLTGYDAVGKECRFLETPDLKAVANAVGGVKVTWNKVEGATSYRIYRRGAGTNYWYYLGDVDATQNTFVDYEGTAKSQIKSGNYYRYTVRTSYNGKDSNGNAYSKYSGFDKGGLYLKYIGTPKMVSVANSASGITIKWKGIVGNGSTWYRIYRRGAGEKGWTYLTQVRGTSYTDTKVKSKSGTTYKYTIRAIVSGKHLSAFESGLAIKRLTNPKLVSATASGAGITVKWGKVNGASAYCVYRKTAGSSWKKIATVKGVNSLSYVDRKAARGTTYTYTVRAYYGGKMSSYNSKGVSARR